jgi:hypothetical protein
VPVLLVGEPFAFGINLHVTDDRFSAFGQAETMRVA